MGANAQAVIAEIDWTQQTEWPGWWYSDYAEVSVEQGTGLIIDCTPAVNANYWEPQVPIIAHIPELKEGGQYQVHIELEFPCAGELQLDLYSWDGSGANMAHVIEVAEGDNYLTIEFPDYPTPCTDAGVFYQCGHLPGKHIIKKVKIIEGTTNFDRWTIAGDKELLDVDWDVSNKKNSMSTYNGINYILTKTTKLSKGTYQFKVYKDNAMQESYPKNNATLEINEDAFYNVKFTFNSNTKELSAIATKKEVLFYNYIPKGKVAEVKSIASDFKGDLTIPSAVTHEGETYTVTKIGDRAFSNSSGLTSVTIPKSVTTIGTSAFYGCTGLIFVTIPNSVTSIGESTFSGCSKLSSIAIPNSVTIINSYTFMGCSSLASVNIPNSVTSIGYSAFSNCKGLTTVAIPNSVTNIADGAFSGCSGLTSVRIPNSVTSIGSNAFSNCTGLTSVSIPSGVTSLSGFSGCTGLTSITIPNSVTSINSYAFQGCTGLTSVTIPNSVSWINDYAFQGCSKLKSVTIGNNVRSISYAAFANCSELTDVYCMAEKLSNEQWGNEGLYTAPDAFNESYIEYATLHVPAAALNNYKNTEPWKKFQNKIALDSGDIPETPKCAKPEISFENGRVKFTCETEGVEYISDVVLADQHKYYDAEIQLSQTYKVSVYATKAGYDNSAVTTREIVITGNGKAIVVGDVDGDGKVNVADHVKLSEIIMNK